MTPPVPVAPPDALPWEGPEADPPVFDALPEEPPVEPLGAPPASDELAEQARAASKGTSSKAPVAGRARTNDHAELPGERGREVSRGMPARAATAMPELRPHKTAASRAREAGARGKPSKP